MTVSSIMINEHGDTRDMFDDDEWSDDEVTKNNHTSFRIKSTNDLLRLDSNTSTSSSASSMTVQSSADQTDQYYIQNKQSYKGSKYFNGQIKLTADSKFIQNNSHIYKFNYNNIDSAVDKTVRLDKTRNSLYKNSQLKLKYPIPKLPIHVLDHLGMTCVDTLWRIFIDEDADRNGFIELEYLTNVVQRMMKLNYTKLPYNNLVFHELDSSDCVSFEQVATLLVDSKLSSIEEKKTIPLPPCCVMRSCKVHRTKYLTSFSENGERKDLDRLGYHHLYMVYNQHLLDFNGKLRYKDLFTLYNKSNVPHDKSKLTIDLKAISENFVSGFDEVAKIYEIIRTDNDSSSMYGHYDMSIFIYKFPWWLLDEMTSTEILVYQHHFELVDPRHFGIINLKQFITLIELLGSSISESDAKDLVHQFQDDQNNNTPFDFKEFIVLIYKIQNSILKIKDNKLLYKIVTNFKSRLNILQHIQDLKHTKLVLDDNNRPSSALKYNVSKYLSIGTYGGVDPMYLNVVLTGPENSMYEGCKYYLKVRFYDGYPYQRPEIHFMNRIYHVNIISEFNSMSTLYHFKYIWEPDWTLTKLFDHILSLLHEPDFSLLPNEMNSIIDMTIRMRTDSGILRLHEESDAKIDDYNADDGQESLQQSNASHIDNSLNDADAMKMTLHSMNQEKSDDYFDINNDDVWSVDSDEPEDMILNTADSKIMIEDERSDFKPITLPSASNHVRKSSIQSSKSSHANTNDRQSQSEHYPASDAKDYSPEISTTETKLHSVGVYTAQPSLYAEDVYEDEEIANLLQYLSRIEQMHLNVMYLYRIDRKRFREVVKYYTERFPVNYNMMDPETRK